MDDQSSELEALERVLTDTSAVPIKLSYTVIQNITENFSREVGRGGFGVVYLGILQMGKVAVKKLNTLHDFSDELFVEEVNCLIRAKHKNIVRFLGYCSDTQGELMQVNQRYVMADVRKRLLCFEYVPNGNLHHYLQEKCHGGEWNIRYQIMKGICEGLHCLHQQRINHLDLKPENVLLDAHMEPKITDFGLSRCFDEKQSRMFTQNFRGTLGYIAPEFIDKGEISFKSDIFSLGIIMIKLLRGCNDYSIDNWHESINVDCPQVKRCIEVAKICVDGDQHSRPSIGEIIDMLELEIMIPEIPLSTKEMWTGPSSSYYEMENFHQEWYKKYSRELHNAADERDPKASQTAEVLAQSIEVDQPIADTYNMVVERKRLKVYVPYNILPLNPECNNHAIMRFPEIRGAVYALQNIRGLQWPLKQENPDEGHTDKDLFDWLQATFGFQKDNASNQREHLILLIANVQTRKAPTTDQQIKLDDDQALDAVMKKLFKNYRKWCKYLGQKSNLWLSTTTQQEVQQYKILYMGLYLLIWGEAANLRFMPECLCYIYHHMALELYAMLAEPLSPMASGHIKLAYGGDEEAFLIKVVTPIHKVIEKEVERSKITKSNHSYWRNYDDLNEYFWSIDCFQLGWPMKTDAGFFRIPKDNSANHLSEDNRYSPSAHWMQKVNFVEIRSFLHIFRSFDRMWIFLLLSLQAMVIVAWNDGTPIQILNIEVFIKLLSIFITAVILNLGRAFLDVFFGWKARRSMSSAVKLRYVLKLISAIAWVVILPVTYPYVWENPMRTVKSTRLGDNKNCMLLYIMAVSIYFAPNILAVMLFIFPFLRKFLESSEVKVISVLLWWSQPRLFVGRQMYEGALSRLKYMMFWVFLLAMKLTVNFYVEIKPLVQPTKDLLREPVRTLQGPNKISGVLIALWAPIILVYFLDTQIWFSLLSTLIGGIYRGYHRIGEIQTMEMFRSHFKTFIGAFNERLIPSDASIGKPKASNEEKGVEKINARVSQLWNLIITTFREEDLIDNREKDLLLLPPSRDRELDIIQWPLFLLAGKITTALDMAADSSGKDHDLNMRMETDPYFSSAITECYASFRNIINTLVFGQREKKIIQDIFTVVDKHIEDGSLIKNMNMVELPTLSRKFVELLDLLQNNREEDTGQVIILFQDMLEVVTRYILQEKEQVSSLSYLIQNGCYQMIAGCNQLFTSINFPVNESNAFTEKIHRLHCLLTIKETAMDIPTNESARRRILFLANSLFMEMPYAPKVQSMLPFSVLTTHYKEHVLFSSQQLEEPNEDGVSLLFYLQKMYRDEWQNFIERIDCWNEEQIWEQETTEQALRLWVSCRMQTLTRTVRGMMYLRKVLELQTFLDMAKDDDLMEGYRGSELTSKESELIAQCKARADMKFTYVVSCHLYGILKRACDPRAGDILRLMLMYPSLRVAYIDEIEVHSQDKNKKVGKVYYSCLVKASEQCDGLDEMIYRIKLPGNPILGEGKQENQNHAVIFTRGECLQDIATNQELYVEEALKMRNILQEFVTKHYGVRYPSILGIKEDIFTGSFSSPAWFMSNQETTFVTIGQRVLANLLRVRFHYGHSDIFDRLFHITRGGLSKASKYINHSGGIFAGFNSTLRGGSITHHEYMQVGKGTVDSFNQIMLHEEKIANNNGQQTLSRDIYRLGQGFDFFRMLSCYHTTIGSYFSTMIAVWTIYAFLYGRLCLVLSGLEETIATERWLVYNAPLQFALASESFVHLGFLMVLPVIMEIGLERGFIKALLNFLLMQLQLASVFFAFSFGTKTHYYGKALLHGGGEHRTTWSGMVFHVNFSENYRLYSRSHFFKSIELMILLLVHEIFCQSSKGGNPYILVSASVWFVVGAWLFAPFLFNPSGFEWQKIVDDWTDWNNWISNRGGTGVPPEKSWESWWEKEQNLQDSGKSGTTVEILLASRFFIYQYGLLYKLNLAKHIRSIMDHGFPMVVIFLIMKTEPVRRRFNADVQLAFPVIKCLLLVRFIFILLTAVGNSNVTVVDSFVFILGFIPTGWGLLLIAQAAKPAVKKVGLWGSIKAIARGYDVLIGLIVFAPIAFFAWFPFVSEIQNKFLFSHAVNRALAAAFTVEGQRTGTSNA